MYDDLRRLISDDRHLVEYGIIEHLYGSQHPDEYRRLVETYGHKAVAARRYTASSFIAGVLGRLYVAGELGGAFQQATGYWSYNSVISYWCPAGAEPTATTTWEEFARDRGIDPMTWPLQPLPPIHAR